MKCDFSIHIYRYCKVVHLFSPSVLLKNSEFSNTMRKSCSILFFKCSKTILVISKEYIQSGEKEDNDNFTQLFSAA